MGLERLAVLGASVQNSLPPVVNELLERGDRPVAVNGDSSGSYLENQYLSEAWDPCMADLMSKAKEQVGLSNDRKERFKHASSVFNVAFQQRFPTLPPSKRLRYTIPVCGQNGSFLCNLLRLI
jgi:hypothetical protein